MKQKFKIGVLIFSAIFLIARDAYAIFLLENVSPVSEAATMLLFGISLIVTCTFGRKILVSLSISKDK